MLCMVELCKGYVWWNSASEYKRTFYNRKPCIDYSMNGRGTIVKGRTIVVTKYINNKGELEP